MKRVGTLLLVLLVGVAVLVVGCGSNEDSVQNQNQMQEQQQGEYDGQNSASTTGADVQNVQSKVPTVTLNGKFNGLADGHSAEIAVDDEATVFQFYDETIAEQLEIMEIGTSVQFDVETDDETGVMTIVKLHAITE